MAEINFPIDFFTSINASFTLKNQAPMRRDIYANLVYGIRPGREYRRFARAYEKMRRIRVKNGYDETNERLRWMAATKVQWKLICSASAIKKVGYLNETVHH